MIVAAPGAFKGSIDRIVADSGIPSGSRVPPEKDHTGKGRLTQAFTLIVSDVLGLRWDLLKDRTYLV